MPFNQKRNTMKISKGIWLTLLVLIGTVITLYFMGREPICKCGYVKFWHGVVQSSENSQHIADWYTPSHILHGLIFFFLTSLFFSKWTFGMRLALSMVVEATWEIVENTDLIINRYRESTISFDYFGDSILNSTSDMLAMALGFYLASKLPVWASIAIFIIAEVFVMHMIRDGLILNIIMLLYPLEIIREWQGAIPK